MNLNKKMWMENMAVIMAFAFLLFIIVGTTPYTSRELSTIDIEGEGSSLRQIIMALIFALSLPFIFKRQQQMKAIMAAAPFFTLVLVWCWLSSLWAISPDISARRSLGSTMVAIMIIFSATLPSRRQVNLLAALLATIVLADWFGLFALHSGSVHAEGGNWKGLHSHKNVAGYFCAIAVIIFTHMAQIRQQKVYYLLAVLSLVFLVFTVSKTSMALMVIILAASYLYRRALWKGVDGRMILVLSSLAMVALMPIVYTILGMVATGALDLTLTGRTEIWEFVVYKISQAPFLGWGYSSFWGVGDLTPAINEASLIVAALPHAHNGYLDVTVSIGFIGLFLVMGALFMPLYQFAKMPIDKLTNDEREVCLYGMVMLTFGILHNLTESSLLQGVVPMWPFMLLGLYMVAATHLAGVAKRKEEHSNA